MRAKEGEEGSYGGKAVCREERGKAASLREREAWGSEKGGMEVVVGDPREEGRWAHYTPCFY